MDARAAEARSRGAPQAQRPLLIGGERRGAAGPIPPPEAPDTKAERPGKQEDQQGPRHQPQASRRASLPRQPAPRLRQQLAHPAHGLRLRDQVVLDHQRAPPLLQGIPEQHHACPGAFLEAAAPRRRGGIEAHESNLGEVRFDPAVRVAGAHGVVTRIGGPPAEVPRHVAGRDPQDAEHEYHRAREQLAVPGAPDEEEVGDRVLHFARKLTRVPERGRQPTLDGGSRVGRILALAEPPRQRPHTPIELRRHREIGSEPGWIALPAPTQGADVRHVPVDCHYVAQIVAVDGLVEEIASGVAIEPLRRGPGRARPAKVHAEGPTLGGEDDSVPERSDHLDVRGEKRRGMAEPRPRGEARRRDDAALLALPPLTRPAGEGTRAPVHRQIARLPGRGRIEPHPQGHAGIVGDGARPGEIDAVAQPGDGRRTRSPPQPSDGHARKDEEHHRRARDAQRG